MSRYPILTVLGVLLLETSVGARPDGHGGMFGQPLYQPSMTLGTLTVKVIRSSMEQIAIGQQVLLKQSSPSTEVKKAKTDNNGRAHFADLVAGKAYTASVVIDGKELSSHPFTAPQKGGVRLLLSLSPPTSMPSSGMPPSGMPPSGMPPSGMPPSSGNPSSMPAGHPPIGPQPSRASSGAARVEPDTELADGVLQIVVLEQKRPVAKAKVSVQVGATRRSLATDQQGQLELTLKQGSPTTLAVEHEGISYSSETLSRPAKGGIRATFTVYGRTKDPSKLRFGPGTHLLARIGEQRVQFRQVVVLLNNDVRLYDPGDGLSMPLPLAAEGVQINAADRRFLRIDAKQRHVLLRAPLPPGKVTLQYTYSLPYSGDTLDFSQVMAVPTERRVFVLQDGGAIAGHGPVIESQRVERMGDQQARIFTLSPGKANSRVELTLTNLPTRDRRQLMLALALAALALFWGLVRATQRPAKSRQPDHLVEAGETDA